MTNIYREIKDLRNSLGDVIEALREQTYTEKHLEDLHKAYLSNSDSELGHIVRKMIDEYIYNVAEEFCDGK